jgi:hypothetical protein
VAVSFKFLLFRRDRARKSGGPSLRTSAGTYVSLVRCGMRPQRPQYREAVEIRLPLQPPASPRCPKRRTSRSAGFEDCRRVGMSMCLTVVIVAKIRTATSKPVNAENIRRGSILRPHTQPEPNFNNGPDQSQSTYSCLIQLTHPRTSRCRGHLLPSHRAISPCGLARLCYRETTAVCARVWSWLMSNQEPHDEIRERLKDVPSEGASTRWHGQQTSRVLSRLRWKTSRTSSMAHQPQRASAPARALIAAFAVVKSSIGLGSAHDHIS